LIFVIGITIVILKTTCVATPNTKRKKGAFAWLSSKNILEIIEKTIIISKAT
jgi:hypothetical protein